jgi:hypothetical protein
MSEPTYRSNPKYSGNQSLLDLIITNDKILFNEIQVIESIAKTCDLAINAIIDCPKYT